MSHISVLTSINNVAYVFNEIMTCYFFYNDVVLFIKKLQKCIYKLKKKKIDPF